MRKKELGFKICWRAFVSPLAMDEGCTALRMDNLLYLGPEKKICFLIPVIISLFPKSPGECSAAKHKSPPETLRTIIEVQDLPQQRGRERAGASLAKVMLLACSRATCSP